MVNYARMETVWRSYGPLEPIGPSAPKRRLGRKAAVSLASILVICGGGAALGAYLRPNLDIGTPSLGAGETAQVATPVVEPAAEQPHLAISMVVPPPMGLPETLPTGGALPTDTIPPSTAPAPLAPTLAVLPSAPAPSSVSVQPPAAPQRVHARIAPVPASVPERPVRLAAATTTAPSRAMTLASREESPRPATAARPTRETPSFDCSGALTAAQEIICERPALVALDRQMAAEIAATVSAGRDARRLQLDQDAWLARREAAAPDPAAVADAYKRRIRQLRAMR